MKKTEPRRERCIICGQETLITGWVRQKDWSDKGAAKSASRNAKRLHKASRMKVKWIFCDKCYSV